MQDINRFWNFHSEGVTSVFDWFLHSQQQVKDGTLEVHYLVQVLQGTQLSLKGEMEKKNIFHSRIQKLQGLQFAANFTTLVFCAKLLIGPRKGTRSTPRCCREFRKIWNACHVLSMHLSPTCNCSDRRKMFSQSACCRCDQDIFLVAAKNCSFACHSHIFNFIEKRTLRLYP